METKIKKDWNDRGKSNEELHRDTKIWSSEIHFINDEIHFLEHLLSSRYIDCLASGLGKKIEISVKKISEEKINGQLLLKQILKHDNMLSDFIKNNSVYSNSNFMENHKKLALEIENYEKKYKRLKKQIFEIVEKIMKKTAQKKLI
ncbi:hypothetical protein [uncultured Lutibacter sp.]|uniref:hypothetical protein n=1 Tax=uncultured Lutibacter sp. TaxID=437739 RepID=UPI00262A98B9|nr:hypothetical protein [uncultured Lutibacter sp.]